MKLGGDFNHDFWEIRGLEWNLSPVVAMDIT